MANIHEEIVELYDKGLKEGIDFEDYLKVEEYNGKLKDFDPVTSKEITEKRHSVDLLISIASQANKSGLGKKYWGNNFNYIIKNSSLLLLALYELAMSDFGEAEVSLKDLNGVKMPCMIPKTKSSSLVVKDMGNRYQLCNGTKLDSKLGTNIDFLSKMHEDLSTNQVIEAICHLYGYEVPDKTKESLDLAYRIRYILANDLREFYKKLLEELRDNLIIENKMLTFGGGRNVADVYNKKIEDIDRIIAGEKDPYFIYNESPKKIILLPQEK